MLIDKLESQLASQSDSYITGEIKVEPMEGLCCIETYVIVPSQPAHYPVAKNTWTVHAQSAS